MPFYPLPLIVTLIGWLFIVATSRPVHIAGGIAAMTIGTLVFLIMARTRQSWPFAPNREIAA